MNSPIFGETVLHLGKCYDHAYHPFFPVLSLGSKLHAKAIEQTSDILILLATHIVSVADRFLCKLPPPYMEGPHLLSSS